MPLGDSAEVAVFRLLEELAEPDTTVVGEGPGFNPMPLVVLAESPTPVPPVNPVLAGLLPAMAPSVLVEVGAITVTELPSWVAMC